MLCCTYTHTHICHLFELFEAFFRVNLLCSFSPSSTFYFFVLSLRPWSQWLFASGFDNSLFTLRIEIAPNFSHFGNVFALLSACLTLHLWASLSFRAHFFPIHLYLTPSLFLSLSLTRSRYFFCLPFRLVSFCWGITMDDKCVYENIEWHQTVQPTFSVFDVHKNKNELPKKLCITNSHTHIARMPYNNARIGLRIVCKKHITHWAQTSKWSV